MSIFLDWENNEHPYPFLKFFEKAVLEGVSDIVACDDKLVLGLNKSDKSPRANL
jgi:hypothetical protein